MSYLLDTNVLSEMRKGEAAHAAVVLTWAPNLRCRRRGLNSRHSAIAEIGWRFEADAREAKAKIREVLDELAERHGIIIRGPICSPDMPVPDLTRLERQ